VTSPGAIARLVRLNIVPLLMPSLFELAAVRRLMFRTVSQTAVNYRGSSLSQGHAGPVHGGDRLPWVKADVNGAAAGAGMSFACACDLRIAADSASFVPAFINIGLVPDSGGSYFVTRILGPARAFEWLASGRKLSAAEAHAWGLVSEVVEPEALAARAAEVAAELAALPTRAVGMTKRLIDHAPNATLEQQLEREAELQTAATQTEDFKEGVAAFLEKRPPQFRGH